MIQYQSNRWIAKSTVVEVFVTDEGSVKFHGKNQNPYYVDSECESGFLAAMDISYSTVLSLNTNRGK